MARKFLLIPQESYRDMVKSKPMPALDERQPIEEAFREAQSVLRNPRLDKSAKKAIYDKRLHNYLMLRKTEMR